MRHDARAAWAFLLTLYVEGPWVLTAIDPEPPKKSSTRTFHPGDFDKFAGWLENHANHNIYYSVNTILPGSNEYKKMGREDIDKIHYLHVDIDPRVGGTFDTQEQAEVWFTSEIDRIAKLLSSPPHGIPRPTLAVSSGGGVNGLWRLQEPIVIGGNLELAEQAKRYNLQLEIDLGGDHCHNIDRILRLPGTVNWPDAKKRAKGRYPAMATLLWSESGAFPMALFKAAPLLQQPGGGGDAFANPTRVRVTGNVPRLSDVAELGDKVSDKTKMLIVQGMDPDDPTKWQSRSELLFYVCCELVRADISDEIIYAVITDPDFRISASVLDKGSGTERYALRQIERAKEEAIAPELRELNGRHAVIANLGGKCRVIEEIEENIGDMPRRRLSDQSFEDFRNRYMNRKIELGETLDGKPIVARVGHWWLEHEARRQYDNVVFAPRGEHPNSYNLWHGFNYVPREGNKHQRYLDHVYENICTSNDEHYQYLIRWMARVVQEPDTPGEIAVVLRGKRGTGKGVFIGSFGRLFGRHYLQVSDPKHLVGSFNAHLRDCVLLFADEAFFAGDKRHESMLKTLITEESLVIEGKGKDAVIGPNYVHLMMASNNNWVVPAGGEERRYFMLDVNDGRMQDSDYFAAIRDDMRTGGYENLLNYLMQLDLKSWQVRKVPKTKALQEQKHLSLNSDEEWWFRKLQTGMLTRGQQSWTDPVLHDRLFRDYVRYSQDVGVMRRSSGTQLGKFLQRVCPPGWPRSRQGNYRHTDEHGLPVSERAYFYMFPPLEQCRAQWDSAFGGGNAWNEPTSDEVIDFDETKQRGENVF